MSHLPARERATRQTSPAEPVVRQPAVGLPQVSSQGEGAGVLLMPSQAGLPFQRHSSTSLAAAVSKEPNAGTELSRVLKFLRRAGITGATDDEMQQSLEMNPSTQRPRRVELVKRKFVKDSGQQRPTATGRQAVVWVVMK